MESAAAVARPFSHGPQCKPPTRGGQQGATASPSPANVLTPLALPAAVLTIALFVDFL